MIIRGISLNVEYLLTLPASKSITLSLWPSFYKVTAAILSSQSTVIVFTKHFLKKNTIIENYENYRNLM